MMNMFKRLSTLLVAILLLASSTASAVTPITQKDLNALIRTSVWYTDDPPEGCADVTEGATPIQGSDDAEKVWNFFIAKGMKPYQVAGIMGNMQHESGIEPQRLQGTASGVKTPAESVGTRNTGWGLVQWTPASKFISTQNPVSNANDIGVQLEFLWSQLQGQPPLSEKAAGDELRATTTMEQAVLAFQGGPRQIIGGQSVGPYRGYERPADKTGSIPQRYTAAKQFMARYGGGAVTSDMFAGESATGTVSISGGCPTGAGNSAAFVGFPLRTTKPEMERLNTNQMNEETKKMSRSGHPYAAYDIFASPGTEVLSVLDGQFVSRYQDKCGGNSVSIYSPAQDVVISYLHMGDTSANGEIKAGQVIGAVGSSAAACGTSPHVHIDTAPGRNRPGCTRENCPAANAAKFEQGDSKVNMGSALYEGYHKLPGGDASL